MKNYNTVFKKLRRKRSSSIWNYHPKAEKEISQGNLSRKSLKDEGQKLARVKSSRMAVRLSCITLTTYSPAFYTHPHGYQMCVGVNSNGYGELMYHS